MLIIGCFCGRKRGTLTLLILPPPIIYLSLERLGESTEQNKRGDCGLICVAYFYLLHLLLFLAAVFIEH